MKTKDTMHMTKEELKSLLKKQRAEINEELAKVAFYRMLANDK